MNDLSFLKLCLSCEEKISIGHLVTFKTICALQGLTESKMREESNVEMHPPACFLLPGLQGTE